VDKNYTLYPISVHLIITVLFSYFLVFKQKMCEHSSASV